MVLSSLYTRSKILISALIALMFAASFMVMSMSHMAMAATHQDKTTIKLGVIEGDEMEVWETAVKYAKEKEGLNIELIPFSDYNIPNEALNNGDIDANAYQNGPFLDAQKKHWGYKITAVGDTSLYPMGAYSRKVKSLQDLPKGSTIGIPSDPSNEGRALRLLAERGLITLDDPKDLFVTPINIIKNPKNLQFQEMDAGMLGRTIDDLTAVIVTDSWVKASGLNPNKELIDAESPENNPYVNFIAVRSEDADKPWVKKLVASFQNDQVREALKTVFGPKLAIPAW